MNFVKIALPPTPLAKPAAFPASGSFDRKLGKAGRPRYIARMTTMTLQNMTLGEKLAAMEALWEDLSRTPAAVAAPAWHKEVLDARQQRVAAGKARSVDWATAKANIRRQVS